MTDPRIITPSVDDAEDGRSDRCSARVEQPTAIATGNRTLTANSAPESMTPSREVRGDTARGRAVVPSAPERPGERRTSTHKTRLSHDLLLRLDRSLSARDLAVLAVVDQHRFLTTHHIQQFAFIDHRSDQSAARITRRVLQRLESVGVLERLEYRIGGVRAGSSAIIWRLGLAGDQIVRLRNGEGVRARRKEPSRRLLHHCLAVADAHLAIRSAAYAVDLEVLQIQTETRCWRSYLDRSGSRLTLKPDLFAAVASADYENHLFVEVDLGTESLPTLIRKCRQYETYRRSGSEQQRRGVFPRVVWVVQDHQREGRLTGALRTARDLAGDGFRVVTPGGLPAVVTEDLV